MTDYSPELRALSVLAAGGNHPEAAKAAGYSDGVLSRRLKVMRRMLSAKNNTALVAILLRAGKLNYPPRLTARPVARSLSQ